jgi:hypothetical protein
MLPVFITPWQAGLLRNITSSLKDLHLVLTSPVASQKLRASKRCGHAALAATWALGALGQALSLKFTRATLATMCANQVAKHRELRSSPSLVAGETWRAKERVGRALVACGLPL